MHDEVKWFQVALSKNLYNHGITERELAGKVDISQAQINRIKNDSSGGSIKTQIAIARVFNYTLPDFLNYGRSLCEPNFDPPPAPEVAQYLDKARKLLEGPKANVVKEFISALSPDD